MTIKHHPGPESLMSCSAGSMPEGFAAVMASHISVCPACRAELDLMEDIGVALFKNISPSAISREAPVMAARREEAEIGAGEAGQNTSLAKGDVPSPLQTLLGCYLDDVPWRPLGKGIKQHVIPLSGGVAGDLRLIKVAPGIGLPEHGHGGSEITLVLRGAYSDKTGVYRAGDVADLDDSVEHRPIADAVEGCICLIASDRKMRFKSVVAKLMQPLTGM